MLFRKKSKSDSQNTKISRKINPLGDLTADQFLQDYWQKKPLLIRQGLPGFTTPIGPDEMAGLACEEDVESRIILEKDGDKPWALEHGPFNQSRFSSLPETHWTLLLQEANRYIPELAMLLDTFNFIPNWRVDDVMVSYAPIHGSVGPHVDQYDVFLIQGLGRRRWQINTDMVAEDNLLENTELKIIKDFHAKEDWILEPGDILYLPPGVAHYGIAMEECMTFSVGFRCPTKAELIAGFVDDLLPTLTNEMRYADPGLHMQKNPGEIHYRSLAKVRAIIQEAVSNNRNIDRWFGRFITEPCNDDLPEERSTHLTPEEFKQRLTQAGMIIRSEYSHFSFIKEPGQVLLYVDGEEYELLNSWLYIAQLICNHRYLKLDMLKPYFDDEVFLNLFCALYNHSKYDFPDDSSDNPWANTN
ncbi:MAG: cupin domain-containing protein [Gammaproteobacteria bacterium]|nr:cupin domain-containing protein [Gammaproteobacteria bacterium]